MTLSDVRFANPIGAQFANLKTKLAGAVFVLCIATIRDDSLARFEATMRNIPFTTGYSPQRWQHAILVELLKKPGNFNVEKPRTIMLLEAQFNDSNKIIGRDIM